jgi:hypothetical protein
MDVVAFVIPKRRSVRDVIMAYEMRHGIWIPVHFILLCHNNMKCDRYLARYCPISYYYAIII